MAPVISALHPQSRFSFPAVWIATSSKNVRVGQSCTETVGATPMEDRKLIVQREKSNFIQGYQQPTSSW